MKKLLLMLLGVFMVFPIMARDFEYTYEGQTLTYTVISEDDMTCMTKSGRDVSGDLVIPTVAIDGATEYQVTEIGNFTFWICDHLLSVTIPNSVTKIGDYAFSGCSSLTSFTIPNSVIEIAEWVFSDCRNLTSITIPNSVTKIGDYALYGCSSLTSITIPESVTKIGDYVFYGCRHLNSIYIPYSVTEIGNYSFSACYDLVSIIITDSVTKIGDYTFFECSCLTSITLPNSLTGIGEGCFGRCGSLISITIPNSVTEIGLSAFGECYGLTGIFVEEDNLNYSSVDGVLFNKDHSLLILYPSSKYGENYVIPNSVTKIEDSAFYGCSSLTSITIPKSVASIGEFSFAGCNSITSVYYLADDPIEADSNSFSYSVYNNATLYVSASGIDKCRQINPWKNFTSIEIDLSGIEEITSDVDTELPYEVYTISGIKVANSTDGLAPGIYIIRQGKNVKKIAVN